MNAPVRPQVMVTLKLGAPLEPQEPQTNELREVVTKDAAGRKITEFEGRPSAWLRQFSCHPKRVTQIRTS
jgi:hypothetical protein